MDIRAEEPEDIEAIREVNLAAFGRVGEANLVDQLRGLDSTVSWVAVCGGQIVGHICFSPVAIADSCPPDLRMLGLAPLAVRPEFQRRGIGSQLVECGLDECTQLGIQAVVVLGSPDYYPRFGFKPAKLWGLGCEYSVPDEAFMVVELVKGALVGCRGTVKYRSEFNNLE